MTILLKDFRADYLRNLLDLLWRQWSALGLAGHASDVEHPWPMDPEALLAFTCTIGRYDPRLFDEVLDWLIANERFVNIQRLKTVMHEEHFAGCDILATLAAVMAERGTTSKWKRLAEPRAEREEDDEYLFRRPDGTPLPIIGQPDGTFAARGWLRSSIETRGMSQSFPATGIAPLWLRLRAFAGVNARCEIILYLLTHVRTNASDVARDTYYFPRTIQDALGEMSQSGLVRGRRQGRKYHYWLPHPATWYQLLGVQERAPVWMGWPPLFAALASIWLCIRPGPFDDLSPMLQMSQLRKCMRTRAADQLSRCGFPVDLPDEERQSGLGYMDDLLTAVRQLLQTLS